MKKRNAIAPIVLVTILIAVAGISFFLYKNYFSMTVPKDNVTTSDTIKSTAQVQNTNVEGNTPKNEIKRPEGQDDKKAETQVNTDPDVREYVSDKFGIKFSYLYKQGDDTVEIKEVGSKIYVHTSRLSYDTGQYVELFEKNGDETLEEALDRILLDGYPKDECEAYTSEKSGRYPDSYEMANIRLTGNPEIEEMLERYPNCPYRYTQSNGISYFLADTDHPDKFLFFSIGQYGIAAPDDLLWQDNVRFVD